VSSRRCGRATTTLTWGGGTEIGVAAGRDGGAPAARLFCGDRLRHVFLDERVVAGDASTALPPVRDHEVDDDLLTPAGKAGGRSGAACWPGVACPATVAPPPGSRQGRRRGGVLLSRDACGCASGQMQCLGASCSPGPSLVRPARNARRLPRHRMDEVRPGFRSRSSERHSTSVLGRGSTRLSISAWQCRAVRARGRGRRGRLTDSPFILA
jgi:hypothetical protein